MCGFGWLISGAVGTSGLSSNARGAGLPPGPQVWNLMRRSFGLDSGASTIGIWLNYYIECTPGETLYGPAR